MSSLRVIDSEHQFYCDCLPRAADSAGVRLCGWIVAEDNPDQVKLTVLFRTWTEEFGPTSVLNMTENC